jgi:alpha-L-rhamnosidase
MMHGIARPVYFAVKEVAMARSGCGRDNMRHPANCALLITVLCLAGVVSPTPAAAQAPHDLHCENAASPRGVKSPRPQLSWVLNPGVVEHAYQVLVASSEEKLKTGEADLWDSGRVISDRTAVPYRGKELSSQQRCYWKVRIWGAYYSAGAYSDPASWEMGLLFFGAPAAK